MGSKAAQTDMAARRTTERKAPEMPGSAAASEAS